MTEKAGLQRALRKLHRPTGRSNNSNKHIIQPQLEVPLSSYFATVAEGLDRGENWLIAANRGASLLRAASSSTAGSRMTLNILPDPLGFISYEQAITINDRSITSFCWHLMPEARRLVIIVNYLVDQGKRLTAGDYAIMENPSAKTSSLDRALPDAIQRLVISSFILISHRMTLQQRGGRPDSHTRSFSAIEPASRSIPKYSVVYLSEPNETDRHPYSPLNYRRQ